jgi:Zn-dependent peptidase ImmA (M78 family)
LGLKQKEVAASAGFSAHQIISQIEAGNRDVKAWELAALSKVLKFNVLDFLAVEQPAESTVLWREDPGGVAVEAEVFFRQKCHDYWVVENASGAKKGPDLPVTDMPVTRMDYKDAERLAHQTSKEMGLGSRPASSIVHVLENKYKIKIWYADLDGGSAATTWGEFGPAILMNLNEAPWRRNYNFAHELFHLLTWDSDGADAWKVDVETWEHIERLANSFASHLLLPGDELSDEADKYIEDNQISYDAMVNIARNFEVSTSALLWRFVSLRWLDREEVWEILDSEEFQSIDRKSMHGAWDHPPDIPERFVRLAFAAYMKGQLSRARLSELLETSMFDLSDKLREYGLDEEADYEAKITVA